MLLALAAAASAYDAKDEAIKMDRKQIEGTWRIVAVEVNGNKVMEDDARKLSVVNGADGTWSLLSEGKGISKGTSTFDPTKKPKTIEPPHELRQVGPAVVKQTSESTRWEEPGRLQEPIARRSTTRTTSDPPSAT